MIVILFFRRHCSQSGEVVLVGGGEGEGLKIFRVEISKIIKLKSV